MLTGPILQGTRLVQLTSPLTGKRPPSHRPPSHGLEMRVDNAPYHHDHALLQPGAAPAATDLGWREAKPGACVFRGQSHTGKQVEVFAMRHGRLECFWSNGEHWAFLEPMRMRAMVEDALARDAFPGVLGY